MSSHQRAQSEELSSPEDGSNFHQSLQIDMKSLIGSAVGNMSIGPGHRDVVLAARKGLFIIDLEAPLNVPRFLPQGGTWDVADVQWNPHITHNEYIVSTSSEKLLIWNLYISGKTSIEHILRSHYRAITDINWHTTDPNVVVSTGIDSWLWSWDLRTTKKPVLGLCAFNAGGTQVKWNRQDGNILASAHANEVLIWDRRKGSLPTSRIPAHSAKIYGIDWAHDRRNELVTCSLDKTIKIWDTHSPNDREGHYEPRHTIQTAYPVWRARDLPFGHGVLSLPQRGETALEMFTPDSGNEPIERFEGHVDVVKEFVWRKGGRDERYFQLITWSTDKTLRFWPVDSEVLERAGERPVQDTGSYTPQHSDPTISFSNPLVTSDLPPALSAPVGNRGILSEVRATQYIRPGKPIGILEVVNVPPPKPNGDKEDPSKSETLSPNTEKRSSNNRRFVGGRSAQITTFAWLSSVKVEDKREGSSGPGSGGESGTVSRLSSTSRAPSMFDPPLAQLPDLKRLNESKSKVDDDDHREDSNQSLQDEITSVVNKLTSSKVKLERADVTRKRTCTFGMHGPWGESTSVFIRITFTFPKEYPQTPHPGGTPQVDLERNPLIPFKSRVMILRKLRTIRETQRPCLEACLRFLLFGDEDEYTGIRGMTAIDSESSDDEAYPIRKRDGGVSIPRGDKNLAEPRTSQGVFGPNGQLVCFFRAPPRIVRNYMRELSASPSVGSQGPDTGPRLFRSPALLSDAIRRLSLAANDRELQISDGKRGDDATSILRIMSNLFTFTHTKTRKFSDPSRQMEDVPSSYSLLPTRRSTVYIRDTSAFIGLDIEAAGQYVYTVTNPLDWCKQNAEIARIHNRVDHERVFTMMHVMLANGRKPEIMLPISSCYYYSPLMVRFVEKLYSELLNDKDVQMLAMISVMLLSLYGSEDHHPPSSSNHTADLTPSSQFAELDYFSPQHLSGTRKEPLRLPNWPQASPSPTAQAIAPALDSPSSSRGSWSSLFSAGHVRRFMAGTHNAHASAVPTHTRTKSASHSPRVRKHRRDSPPNPNEAVSTSIKSEILFSSNTYPRRPTFSQVVTSGTTTAKKRINFNQSPKSKNPSNYNLLGLQLKKQLACHILSYAEMLSAWQYPGKRGELLKSIEGELKSCMSDDLLEHVVESSPLGVVRLCEQCHVENQLNVETCLNCANRLKMDRCSVCRLPIKGLSHTCIRCLHDAHVQCWAMRKDAECATGCGCICKEIVEENLADSLLVPASAYSRSAEYD